MSLGPSLRCTAYERTAMPLCTIQCMDVSPPGAREAVQYPARPLLVALLLLLIIFSFARLQSSSALDFCAAPALRVLCVLLVLVLLGSLLGVVAASLAQQHRLRVQAGYTYLV